MRSSQHKIPDEVGRGYSRDRDFNKKVPKEESNFRKQFSEYTNDGNDDIDQKYDIKKVGEIND